MATPILAADADATPELSSTRILGPWYAIQFLNSYAATLFSAGCYDYAGKQLHAAPSTQLWLSTAWGGAYIFISLIAGRLSERFSPRRVVGFMVFASFLTALLGLASILSPVILLLFAIMLPFNFTSSTLWPALESGITRARAAPPTSTRIAFYNLSWSSSGFAAYFTCGALEKIWWGNIFVIPAACCLIGWLLFLISIPKGAGLASVPMEEVAAPPVSSPSPPTTAAETARRKHAKAIFVMALLGNALSYVASNTLVPIKTPLAAAAGITALSSAAAVTSIWSFARFFGFFITWKWDGWHYKIRWLIGSQVALAGSFILMLTLHTSVVLIFTQIVFGLCTALIYASALYYAMHTSDGHGGHAGMHEALIGVGIAIGPAIGALASSGDYNAAALSRVAVSVTVLLVIGIVAMAWLAPRGTSAMRTTG